MSAKYDKITASAKENNKKIKDLKDENDKLKNNINLMQTAITERNNKIAQIEIMNTRLYTHNNHLTELYARGKLIGKGEETADSREEDELNSETSKKNRKKWGQKQRNRWT